MIRFSVLLLILASLSLTACSGGQNNVGAVTPLPAHDSASSPTPTLTPSTQALDPTETPEPATADDSEASANDPNTDGSTIPGLATAPAIEFAGLEPGESREIARATDMVMTPAIEEPLNFDSYPVSITFAEFYDGWDMRRGMVMSDKLMSLDGQQIVMEGYVAPPLKPLIDFFVLTRIQLAFCPFCSADTEWPTDIAVVYMPTQEVVDTAYPVRVTGTLEIGPSIDADSGMVSMIRIYAENIETLN